MNTREVLQREDSHRNRSQEPQLSLPLVLMEHFCLGICQQPFFCWAGLGLSPSPLGVISPGL